MAAGIEIICGEQCNKINWKIAISIQFNGKASRFTIVYQKMYKKIQIINEKVKLP